MTSIKSKNRVYVTDDDIVELIVVGDQTVDSVHAMGDRAGELGRKQWADGKPSLLLDNLNQMGNVPPNVLSHVIQIARKLNYDKLAMVSGNKIIKATSNTVLAAIGKLGKVRFFDNRDAAVKWLKNGWDL